MQHHPLQITFKWTEQWDAPTAGRCTWATPLTGYRHGGLCFKNADLLLQASIMATRAVTSLQDTDRPRSPSLAAKGTGPPHAAFRQPQPEPRVPVPSHVAHSGSCQRHPQAGHRGQPGALQGLGGLRILGARPLPHGAGAPSRGEAALTWAARL